MARPPTTRSFWQSWASRPRARARRSANGGLQAGRAFGNALHARAFSALPGTQAGGSTAPTGMMPLGVKPTQTPGAGMVPSASSRLQMWASAFDERTRTSGSDTRGTAEQTARQSGVATGADVRLAPDVLAGLAAGYSEGGVSTNARASHVSTTGYHLGGYGLKRIGNFYLSGSASYAGFDNRSKRTVAGIGPAEVETASFSSNVISARVEVGQDFALGAARVTPFFSLEAARYFAQAFTEESARMGGGAGTLGLAAQAARVDAMPATLGVRLRGAFGLPMAMRVEPSVSLAWVHNFARDRALDASFSAIPTSTFTVAGARADADLLQARAGLDVRLSDTVTLGGEIGTEQGAHTQNVSAKGDIRITW